MFTTHTFTFVSMLFAIVALPSPRQQGESAPQGTKDAFTVSVPQFPNPTCAIMAKPISDKLWTETEKGRIYICCKACIKKIHAAPEQAYRAAYPKLEKVGNKVCPITGEAIKPESPKIVLQGREIALCCEDCIPAARAASQVVLVKATNPKVVDVGNAVCPINGEAVAPNAFCLIGDQLVHLSSSERVEDVRKDPKAALAKAVDLAAKKAKPAKPKGPEDGHGERHGHGDEDGRE